MSSPRNGTIDFLRGFAVILIILIHVTYYFRDNTIAAFLWEYSQVAVPIFVFCSAYVFFSKEKDGSLSFAYFYKRVKRLLIPYYIYLFVFFAYVLLLKHQTLSLKWTMEKIFFTNVGSQDIDWLVVLFLYFLVLMPFIRFLSKKTLSLWIFALISFASSILFLFIPPSLPFRLTLWLPWSMVLILAAIVVRDEKKPYALMSLILSFLGLYLISRGVLIGMEKSLVLRNNKYPPNLYYLSYGIFLMLLMYMGYEKLTVGKTFLQKWFDFLSKYSYSIFFIHFLLLYYFIDFTTYKQFQWWSLFAVIFVLTMGVQIGLNYFFSILKRGPTI